jgi:hypothetical protein
MRLWALRRGRTILGLHGEPFEWKGVTHRSYRLTGTGALGEPDHYSQHNFSTRTQHQRLDQGLGLGFGVGLIGQHNRPGLDDTGRTTSLH